ncbi:MAG: dynamin family protein [Clostridiales bacterium]|nr:dynamin family protein [Clostridiales bacterium]
MAQVYVKYNPYKLETEIRINGNAIAPDSDLFKLVQGKRLQEWVAEFPKMLVDEQRTMNFEVRFYGLALDWDDFENAFLTAKENKIVAELKMEFQESSKDESDVNGKIKHLFQELQEGPVEDFRDPKLIKKFKEIDNAIFPINVIATMSSGKSTLINALLQCKLMPSKNEACTATITEILDTDADNFSAVVYDAKEIQLEEVPVLNYDTMCRLNDDESVSRIAAEGNIPFLDATTNALMLVDTPGPNNSQNQAHKNTTYRAINNNSDNLILYVLNATQLKTNDDADLLRYVAAQIKKGGRLMHDRFLFVINKMDGYDPEEEDIGEAIKAAKEYLESEPFEIENPQIYPCSAYAALNIRTLLAGVDIDSLTRTEQKKLPSAARDTLPMIDKFNDYESMHLEKYTTLSPSAQRELEFRLKQAENESDTKEQALIHSGIYSIEAAISAYVKKYAKTKKVRDLAESFSGLIEDNKILTGAKMRIREDEEAAKQLTIRKQNMEKKLENGENARKYQQNVDALDPMTPIRNTANELRLQAEQESSQIFDYYGDVIRDKELAKRMIRQFSDVSSNALAKMTVELESTIDKELVEAGKNLLQQYQAELAKMDEEIMGDKSLDFGSVDLIRGALENIREDSKAWGADDFALDTVEEVGETTYETRVWYEKIGEEEVEELVGYHTEVVGTERKKVGSHVERKTVTKTKRNPKKKGLFGKIKIWQPDYIEYDDIEYDTVDDYEDIDITEQVADYQKKMRDIFEKKEEQVEKFSADVAEIQSSLLILFEKSLDLGLKAALHHAEEQVDSVKEQFKNIFLELDSLLLKKYQELDDCTVEKEQKETELKLNRAILKWIEACQREVQEILEI